MKSCLYTNTPSMLGIVEDGSEASNAGFTSDPHPTYWLHNFGQDIYLL